MMLYHAELGIPTRIKSQIRQTGLVCPQYSAHALTRASERSIELPRIIDYTKCEPFEIEVKRDGTIIKVSYRMRYELNKKVDLVLVINPHDNFVRTIWLNQTDDQHASLDLSKYEPSYKGV